MAKVAPSIITGNMCEIGSIVRMLDSAGTDWIHLDIMDGNFVPNITFGPKTVKDIRKITSTFLDVHLMVNDPNTLYEEFAKAGADMITVHYEAPGCTHLNRLLKKIRESGTKVGIALNPTTPETVLDYILEDVDLVLLMSVNPGFGGQKFIPYTLRKIERTAERIQKLGLPIEIEIDGGVNLENAKTITDAGATVLIAGHAVIDAEDPFYAVRKIQGKA